MPLIDEFVDPWKTPPLVVVDVVPYVLVGDVAEPLALPVAEPPKEPEVLVVPVPKPLLVVVVPVPVAP